MFRFGPIVIARTAEIERQYAQAVTAAAELHRLNQQDAGTAVVVVNADLQAACQAADAYLHAHYPRLDAEQQALCNQLVAACAEANALTLGLLDSHLPPKARARIQARVNALVLPDVASAA